MGYQTNLYKDWAKRGVYMINNVLNETGKIMSFQKFQDTYNIQTNFLTYHGVIIAISFYIKLEAQHGAEPVSLTFHSAAHLSFCFEET